MKPKGKNAGGRRVRPDESAPQRKPNTGLFFCLGLLALTVLAFSNSFTAGFPLDNKQLILGDPRIREATAENIGLIFRHTYFWPAGEAGIYRPLATLSYLLNYAIFDNGTNPAGYHSINLLLHCANVLLVFALGRRLLGSRGRALFLAALWAVHPAVTESVTNIIGRSDLLAAAAVLGGFLMYLRGAETTGAARRAWLAGVAFMAAAGVASKESAVILPAVILAYELIWWKDRQRLPLLIGGCLAAALPAGAVLLQRASVLAASGPAEFSFVDNPIVAADFPAGLLTALAVLGRYLKLAVWPLHLSADYSYPQIPLVRGTAADWALCLLVAAAAAVALIFRRNRAVFFFLAFAFLAILPASNLFVPTGTIMAERLLYLPLVGLLAGVVILLDHLIARAGFERWAPVLFGILALAFTARTWARNRDWKDDLTMAESLVRTSPLSFKSHLLLAESLQESDPSHAQIDRIAAEADRSAALLGDLPNALRTFRPWNIAAFSHLLKGDLEHSPDSAAQYVRTANLARRSIEIEAAVREAYNRAHAVNRPPSPPAAYAWRMLANADLRLNKPAEALEAAAKALQLDPSSAEAYADIADADLRQNRAEDAAIALAQGMLATADPRLRGSLLELYRKGLDSQGCAIVPGPMGPALNPSCAIVRRHLCEGAARAGKHDELRQLGCPD